MKTMKAAEVLRRYETGERDFRGINLRGQSFKNKDLSGADFSQAKIQGTNFAKAKLEGTNFSNAEAGLQPRWVAFLVLASLCLSAISGLLSGFAGGMAILGLSSKAPDGVLFGASFLIALLALVITTYWKGLGTAFKYLAFFFVFVAIASVFTGTQIGSLAWDWIDKDLGLGWIGDLVKALIWFAVLAVAVAVPLAIFRVVDWNWTMAWVLPISLVGFLLFVVLLILSSSWANAWTIFMEWSRIVVQFLPWLTLSLALVLAWALTGILAEAEILAVIGARTEAKVVARVTPGIVSGIMTVVVTATIPEALPKLIAMPIALAMAFLGTYFGWCALAGNRKFAFAEKIAIAFSTTGGTNFYGADLTAANFTKATLKSTDLRRANLTHTCWDQAQTRYARFDESNLKSPQINIPTKDNPPPSRQPENLKENLVSGDLTQLMNPINTDVEDNSLQKLYRSFAKVYDIKDPIERHYKLIQEAKQYDIPLEYYDRMFKSYCEKKREPWWFNSSLLEPFHTVERFIEGIAYWFGRLDIFQILQQIGLIIAVFVFLLDYGGRKEKSQYEAWQVINSVPQEQKASGGRIQALEKLNKDRVPLAGLSAPNADLTDVELENADLRRANLSAATLNKANFRRADLRGADLKNAQLKDADLSGALYDPQTTKFPEKFDKSNLYKIVSKTKLPPQADLQKVDLHDVDLSGAVLEQVNLQGAKLQKAILKWANLKQANLREANLEEVEFRGANLIGADLQGAENLSRKSLATAIYDNSTKLPLKFRIQYQEYFTSKVQLKDADLHQANFQDADLQKANLESAGLQRADLKGAKLQAANLQNADLEGADLQSADLTGADLRNAKNLTPEQVKVARNWKKAQYDDRFRQQLGLASKVSKQNRLASKR